MASVVEELLREAHRAAPGMTPRAFASLRDDEGRSSYDRLARLVDTGGALRVLDLACGDGFLLERVRQRAPSSALCGLDLSPEELALARARLPDAELAEGRVQALPWEDGSFDRVVCHMAFMLFDAVEEVVAEVARVLRPGGRVGVVVGSNYTSSGVARTYGDTFRELAREVGAPSMAIGDPRARDPEGLRGLFADRFEVLSCTRVEVRQRTDVDGVWRTYRDMYNHRWLTPAQRVELERRFRAALECDEEGVVVVAHEVLELVGRRRA